jgi:hypothetical protein
MPLLQAKYPQYTGIGDDLFDFNYADQPEQSQSTSQHEAS